jgi:hypothetical protein
MSYRESNPSCQTDGMSAQLMKLFGFTVTLQDVFVPVAGVRNSSIFGKELMLK